MKSVARKTGIVAVALSVTYFVLWGCMPLASVAPPLPGVTDGRALTGGAVLEFWEIEDTGLDAGGEITLEPHFFPAAGVQYWSRKEGRVDRGLVVFFDYPTTADGAYFPYLGAGGFLELPLVEKPGGQISVQASVGLAWARIGFPISWQSEKGRHFYTHPSWTAGSELYTHIPIGWIHNREKGGQGFHEIGAVLALDSPSQNPSIFTYTYGWEI